MFSYRFVDHTLVARDDGATFPWNSVTGRPVADLGHIYEQWIADGQPTPAPYEAPEPIVVTRAAVDEHARRRRREMT
jgi:hypothetical protein